MPDTEWPVNGTPAKLISEQPQTSGSDVTYLLTTLQQRITCVRLPDPHLTALQPPFPHRSPRRSSTNAACGGLIPSPAGRHRRANHPSSIAQHRIKKLGLHQTPFCVRDTRGLRPPPARRSRRATQPPSLVQHRSQPTRRHSPSHLLRSCSQTPPPSTPARGNRRQVVSMYRTGARGIPTHHGTRRS
jgi:hypothetical protein